MVTRSVVIPGPVVLIYSGRFLADVENRLTPFMQEVDGLARQGMLPVTLEVTAKGWRMAMHAARYVAWLYPTQAGDAYNLGHAARRQFRDEDRLVKRALLVRCPGGFRALPDLRTVNAERNAGRLPATTTYGDYLWQQWQTGEQAGEQPSTQPPAHGRYLDLLELVVEAGRQIEAERYAATPPFHYVSRSVTKEQRYSARPVYRFRVVGREGPAANTMVCLGDMPQVRGKVIRVDGRDVTVRFEPGADFDHVAGEGTLRLLPSERVFRAQREAIELLRRRETRNLRLLDSIASASFLPYRPATDAQPEMDLDPDQLNAFRCALAVPDILNVLGPPGAGKTTTIIEVVKTAVAQGQRVLITSHTHRAVDNVLEGLPSDLNVVRIGSEDNMSSKVKALSSESRAESVRKEILADTALLDGLAQVRAQRPVLDRYLAHLRALLDQAGAAQAQRDRLEPAINEAMQRATAPLRAQLTQAEQALNLYRSQAAAHEASLTRTEQKVRVAQAKADSGSPLAFVWQWLLNRRRGRFEHLSEALVQDRAAVDQAESAWSALRGQAEHLAAHDPQVSRLTTEREQADKALAALWPDIIRAGS
jgi:hypothetical protein